MLKGCTPPDGAAAAGFYNATRRREVRALYYAMIAEFDALVGTYVAAVEGADVAGRTVFVVTSDHGDMQMEKQQFYKVRVGSGPWRGERTEPTVAVERRRPSTSTSTDIDVDVDRHRSEDLSSISSRTPFAQRDCSEDPARNPED